jgi:hypothetical protein
METCMLPDCDYLQLRLISRQKCSVCDVREGACIQCSKSSCFLAFHPTCARKEKFLMPMKSAHGFDAPSLACYCEKHLSVGSRLLDVHSILLNLPSENNKNLGRELSRWNTRNPVNSTPLRPLSQPVLTRQRIPPALLSSPLWSLIVSCSTPPKLTSEKSWNSSCWFANTGV